MELSGDFGPELIRISLYLGHLFTFYLLLLLLLLLLICFNLPHMEESVKPCSL